MENTHSAAENNSDIRHDGLFGVSSDDIIDLLHKGELSDVTNTAPPASGPDKDQIVNEQDQLDIVNPAEEETSKSNVIPASETPSNPRATEITEIERITGDKEISGQVTNEEINKIQPAS